MKQFLINTIKSFLFIGIFGILFYFFTFLSIPKVNVGNFLLSEIANYSILNEYPDTVDVIAIGDSLIYSSIIPMDIYGEYGYTVFNSAEAASILPVTIKNLELGIRSQHPKIIIVEASIFYRDERKSPVGKRLVSYLRPYSSLIQTHNNWKKLLSFGDDSTRWINIEKGYKYNDKVEKASDEKYMKYTRRYAEFPYKNLEYFKQFLQMCEDNNIKLIVVSFPTQSAWNYKKHNYMSSLAEEYGIDFIDLNLKWDLYIDWRSDSKDGGKHLNYYGAQKVTRFLGQYLNELNILEDHRNDEKYKAWDQAYKHHLNSLNENN